MIGRLKIWWRLRSKRWHHVVVTCDKRGIQGVYVDGNEVKPKPPKNTRTVSFWVK